MVDKVRGEDLLEDVDPPFVLDFLYQATDEHLVLIS
jgi:hypothetical protein